MKVVLTSVQCGPDGNGFPGTVLDIPGNRMQKYWDAKEEKEAEMPLGEYLVANKFARPFDSVLDRKAKQFGLMKAAER